MYGRFKALESYGDEELEKLQESTVAVVGLGATGSIIAENLARHGVNLLLLDRDYLEMNDCYSSNIYTVEECENSIPKAKAAEEYLSQFTEVNSKIESVNPDNVDILEEVDLVMDGTDNLETRFIISEFCEKEDIPWIYTAAIGEKGFSMLFDEKCFNCVFKDISAGSLETCEVAGIMREVSNIAASKSSWKAVKYLAGGEVEETLEIVRGETFGVEGGECEVCSKERLPHLEQRRKVTSVCGENKYQVDRDIDEEGFERVKQQAESFTENEYLLRAEIDGRNITVFRDGRAIIEARDKGHAEAIYSEKIGV